MNKLPLTKRANIINMLVEGVSLRATSRIADCSINTVTKLLVDVGSACSNYQDEALRNLPCKRIEVDEIWAYCYAKKKNVPKIKKNVEGAGDVWTWTAICADTKLVPSWFVGDRNEVSAKIFIDDLASRLANRIQLTTDGYKLYLEAIANAYHGNIDYAMLVKVYGDKSQCLGSKKSVIVGNPDIKKISTSYVERQNLTMRMSMRRFTRLTNGFSKKIENHAHAVALYFMYYNFGRIHKTLKISPAMEAGVTNKLWSLEDIVNLTNNYSN